LNMGPNTLSTKLARREGNLNLCDRGVRNTTQPVIRERSVVMMVDEEVSDSCSPSRYVRDLVDTLTGPNCALDVSGI